MAMEDLGQPQIVDTADKIWMGKIADSLASIYISNRGKGLELSWLPIADDTYWCSVVTQLSIDHFERKMEQDGFLPKT